MELLISAAVKERLLEAGIQEEEVRKVFAFESGGVLDPLSGTVVKGGQVGSITLWISMRPTRDGYQLENAYYHRIAVDGVVSCTEN